MDGQEAFRAHVAAVNSLSLEATNAWISDDYFGVFCVGDAGTYELYRADDIREGSRQALTLYEGREPYWAYEPLSSGARGSEFIQVSRLDFSLGGDVVMSALVTEVFRLEDGGWKLVRQYMEKFRPS